jgi:hypothetical protein
VTQTQSKPKANEKLMVGKAAPAFEVLEIYEAMLRVSRRAESEGRCVSEVIRLTEGG